MVLATVNPEVESVVSLETATRVVVILEYDGTRYHGFQIQTVLPTIQGEMEKALQKLTGERARVMSASRTDAGVHARGQVVSFRTRSLHSLRTFVDGLNYYLPRDIVVKTAHRVNDFFDVRRQALSREYCYYLLNSVIRSPLREGFAHRVSGELDIEAMNQACQVLIGEHDFASFASSVEAGKKTIRRVYRAEVTREGDLAVFTMLAKSFLPHQVRGTVGALIRVGQGKMSGDEFLGIMDAKKIGLAGPAAPAGGLCLMQVNYPHPFVEEIIEKS